MHVYSEVIWHYLIMAALKLLPKITTVLFHFYTGLQQVCVTVKLFITWLHKSFHAMQCYSFFCLLFLFNLNHPCVASFVLLYCSIYGR